MKTKILVAALALLMIFLSACGAQPTSAESTATPEESGAQQDDTEMSVSHIGFSLKSAGAFSDQLAAEVKAACEGLGYEPNIVTADSAEQQKKDIASLLSAGVSVIVANPVDVDALESELSECETENVPVINVVNPINGTVSTLISPDYIEVGKAAGKRAVKLYGEQGGKCLELKTDYDSFVMQLMSDGFASAVAEDAEVTIAADEYCGYDEEKAYEAAKAQLGGDIQFIFAQSAELARGAMRAIEESGKTVTLVAFGGDMDLIQAVSAGKMDTALFIDPAQIAQKAVGDADSFIKDAAYAPAQYQQLDIHAVNADNVSDYLVEGGLYAKAPAQS